MIKIPDTIAVHCKWGEWNKDTCSEYCGGGKRTKTRKIKTKAEHGGNECKGETIVREDYNKRQCKGNIAIKLR